MKRPEEILNLQNLLQKKFGSAQAFSSSPLQNNNTLDLDAMRQGTVCEIIAAASSGVGLSIQRLLDRSKQKGHAALIDGRDSFDPPLSDDSLNPVLWVRCHRAEQAMKSADWLLRDGNLALVVLDLQLNPPHETRRIPASSWYRLRALAKETDTALVVFSAQKTVPCSHTRWILKERFPISAMDESQKSLSLKAVLERHRPQTPALIAKTG